MLTAIGWDVEVRQDAYVAFGGQGVRVAIFSRRSMSGVTDGHPAYAAQFTRQAFELNLQCESADEVERRYDLVVAAGATPTGRPA